MKIGLFIGANRLFYVFIVGVALCSYTQAQDNSLNTKSTCVKPVSAPEWMPCGPNRILSPNELRIMYFKPDKVTKMLVTGVPSGRKLRVDFRPNGKLEMGIVGGSNMGNSWKIQDEKVCRSDYDPHSRGAFDCGPFELLNDTLYLVDGQGNKSPITSIEFVAP